MAAAAPPVLVGAGTAAFETTPGASFTPSLPPGWAVGDLLLLLFTHTGSTGALAAPGGWRQLAQADNGVAQRTELWLRRAGRAETSPTLQLAANGVSTTRGARIYAIRGVADADPSPPALQLNPSPSASVPFAGRTTTSSYELVLLLAAYAADPFETSTPAGWTQPSLAVQGYSLDPWSGSYTVDDADPDVPPPGALGIPSGDPLTASNSDFAPSGYASNPGAALIHLHRTAPAPTAVPGGALAVSVGPFAVGASTTLTLALVPTPTAALRVRARIAARGQRVRPALMRVSAVIVARAMQTARQPVTTGANVRLLAATLKLGLTAALARARSRGTSLVDKLGTTVARGQARSSAVVDSMRTPQLYAAVAPRARSRGTSTAIARIEPGPLPVRPPIPRDLGEIYRGDTVRLPVWAAVARNGLPIDLTGLTLRFTAKLDLGLADEAPTTINASSEDGTIAVLDPPVLGRYRVTIPAAETQDLEIDGSFTFDVQLEVPTAPISIHTLERGRLLVNRDVTRS